MPTRKRDEGWSYAKKTGHKNEELVKDLLDTDISYAYSFLQRLNLVNDRIVHTEIGGLHEPKVNSVMGGKKNAKTDLKIFTTQCQLNVSIKKSFGGQVYLIGAQDFIDLFEYHFHKHVPCSVQRAIKLFWAQDAEALTIIDTYSESKYGKSFDLQCKHKSLNATTLHAFNLDLYNDILDWFSQNIYEITKLSFSLGAASAPSDWAEFIWYINMLGEHNVDAIFLIEDLCNASKAVAYNEVFFGTKNGGTTIQLPFGSVQWHQRKLEFRHSYDKISSLIRPL